jgi:hypothetical protein
MKEEPKSLIRTSRPTHQFYRKPFHVAMVIVRACIFRQLIGFDSMKSKSSHFVPIWHEKLSQLYHTKNLFKKKYNQSSYSGNFGRKIASHKSETYKWKVQLIL